MSDYLGEEELAESTPNNPAAQVESELKFLRDAADLLTKSASTAEALEVDLTSEDSSRFAEREQPVSGPSDDDEADDSAQEETATRQAREGWATTPSVKDQVNRYPDSIRMIDPETKVLDLSNPAHLAEYNRLQRESADLTKRKLAITELERQAVNGTWVALVTYYRVEYQVL